VPILMRPGAIHDPLAGPANRDRPGSHIGPADARMQIDATFSGSPRILQDHVRGFFSNHYNGGVGVA
jgi:hypothetical protein